MIIVAVSDANIFIDLIALDLIEAFLSLDLIIWTTEEVLMELYPDDMDRITSFDTLQVDRYDQHKRSQLTGLSNRFSSADKSLLELVHSIDSAILLSGEKRMRSWCSQQKIEVHGIIWVLQLMIDHNILKPTQAASHLSRLLTINNWLPTKTCLDHIDRWRAQPI